MPNILIVEDDEFFREALTSFLSQKHYHMHSAENGKTARDIISSTQIDLIITDIQMPHFTGVELLEWVNQNKPTPVIMMTGFSNLIETVEAYEMGAKGFLTKPFKHEELLQLIQDVLGKRPQDKSEEDLSELHEKYCQIPIREFVSKPDIDFDVFIRLSQKKYIKIGHAGSTLPIDRLQEYREKGVNALYIRPEDLPKILDFNLQVMDAINDSEKVSPEKKANFMRYTSELILEKCFVDGIDQETFHDAQSFFSQSVNSMLQTKNSFDLINVLNDHSNHVYAHSLGTALYAVMIARMMGMEATNTFYKLSMAGLFHDIGKKEIPEEILNKPRPLLGHEERQLIESHPTRSKEILRALRTIPSDVVQICYEHHEDCLGFGFPRGINKLQMHPLSKIIQLANAFVELTLQGPNHKGMPANQAIQQLNTDAERFDKNSLNALKEICNSQGKDEKRSA